MAPAVKAVSVGEEEVEEAAAGERAAEEAGGARNAPRPQPRGPNRRERRRRAAMERRALKALRNDSADAAAGPHAKGVGDSLQRQSPHAADRPSLNPDAPPEERTPDGFDDGVDLLALHEPAHPGAVARRVMAWLPFERQRARGPVPPARLFALLLREIAHGELAALQFDELHPGVAFQASCRLVLYEDRLGVRVQRESRRFGEETEAAAIEEEGEAFGRLSRWLTLAATSRTPLELFNALRSESGMIAGLSAVGEDAPSELRPDRAFALCNALVRLKRVPKSEPRRRLVAASQLYRLLLSAGFWATRAESAFARVPKAALCIRRNGNQIRAHRRPTRTDSGAAAKPAEKITAEGERAPPVIGAAAAR